MKTWLLRSAAFLLAIVTATVLGCVASTQFVIAGLEGIGVRVSLTDRLSTTVHDVIGMGPMLFLVYGLTLLLGFFIASLCNRWLPGSRHMWISVGGALAVLSVLLLMSALMGGMPIAGARGVVGLLTQAVVGAVAGYVFARVTNGRGDAPA